MNMYAFNYQANLPSSNSDNIGSGTAHNTHCCCEMSPGCCVVSLTVRSGKDLTISNGFFTCGGRHAQFGRSLLSVLWLYHMRVVRPERHSKEKRAQLFEEKRFVSWPETQAQMSAGEQVGGRKNVGWTAAKWRSDRDGFPLVDAVTVITVGTSFIMHSWSIKEPFMHFGHFSSISEPVYIRKNDMLAVEGLKPQTKLLY